MKEHALALVADVGDPSRKLNLLREYVQELILRSFHESEAATALVFVGGTALRMLHNLPRFSEDLDFSMTEPATYDPSGWLAKLKRDLTYAGFSCRIRWNERKTVNVGWVQISELLQAAGLASRAAQNLSIKLEIDTRPPRGGMAVRQLITRHMTFVVRHHDLASLMAGKVHALITRGYPKGRDWFDLIWYRSHRPPLEPNLVLLQNALDQTRGEGSCDAVSWRELVKQRLATLDVEELLRDVRPFLERPADAALLTRDNIVTIL
jgi:hypothetical protein